MTLDTSMLFIVVSTMRGRGCARASGAGRATPDGVERAGGSWTEPVVLVSDVGLGSAHVATTDRQHDAGDVRGLIRGEEEDGADLFVDRAVALHQAPSHGLVPH